MKVLVVSNMYPNNKYPHYGTFVKKFTNEIEVLSITYDKIVMKKEENSLVKYFKYLFFYMHTFFRIILSSYDIVYVHYISHSSIPILLAKKFKNFRLFSNVHGSDVVPENSKQIMFQKITSRALQRSDKIIVPSQYFLDYVSKKYSINKGNIYIYPSGGVDTNIFNQKNSLEVDRFMSKYNIPNKKLTFGIAGRLSENKGWDTFLYAVHFLVKEGIDANYIVVGNGREEKKYFELIEKLNLSNHIIKLDMLPQSELAIFYNVIDYLVFPSKREGESLGLVPLEAMACGTPVISTNYAAPKDYIVDGVNGYTFPVDDYKLLSEKMKRIVIQSEKYNKELIKNAIHTSKKYQTEKTRVDLKKILLN